MILARAVVLDVLAPRLTALAAVERRSGGRSRGGNVGSGERLASDWLDVLLDFHVTHAASCRQGSLSGRFYSWTEYSLYFVAAAASRAIGQYHDFSTGGITSIRWSMMKPWQWDAADWGAIFADATDPRPFFIVHSWFGKAIEETDARLAQHIPTLARGALDSFPVMPSPAPYW